jgi:hypothetical protein
MSASTLTINSSPSLLICHGYQHANNKAAALSQTEGAPQNLAKIPWLRPHVDLAMIVMFLSIALASIAWSVIAAAVALSPTLKMENVTEIIILETIRAGSTGCAFIISTANVLIPGMA